MASLTRHERDDLMKLARQRERLAKAMTSHRAAEILADFEAQMAAAYPFDQDATWKAATEVAEAALKEARAVVDRRCEELGIPQPFRPSLHMYWSGRGENATAQRRTELRKVATTRVAAMEKQAKVAIEAASLQIQTALLADGLTSDAAHRSLRTMASPEELMPSLAMSEVAGLLGAGRRLG